MSACCFSNRTDAISLLLGTKENVDLTFYTLTNYFTKLLEFFWLSYLDMYKLKQPLGGALRKKVPLKFGKIKKASDVMY